MASTAKQLAQAAVTTGTTTLYTVPGATTTILKSFDICNTTPGVLTIRLYLVPSAGSPGTGNALLYDYQIPANSTGLFGWEGEQVLATGATIQTSASGTGLTLTASGVEIA